MFGNIKNYLADQLQEIRKAGLYKSERIITSPQRARVSVGVCPDFREVKMGPSSSAPVLERQGILNLCANNYLGLADHPEVIRAAHEALDRWGYGLASVRFTHDVRRMCRILRYPGYCTPDNSL